MAEKKLLWLAAAALNKRMIETFSKYHVYPYDVQAVLVKSENGLDVILSFPPDFSQVMTKCFSFEQATHPGEDVTRFFTEAAEKFKTVLIMDYFKMNGTRRS